MTIRSRLTWTHGIAVVATIAVLGVLVWWQMSDALVSTLQTALATRAESILSSLENSGQSGLQETDQSNPQVWSVLLDTQGRIVDSSVGAPAVVQQSAGTFDGGGGRYMTRVDVAQDGTTVVTGADLGPVAAAQSALARILLGVGLAVGLASVLLTWWLAGRALRPIDQLITDSEALTPDDLGRRLEQAQGVNEVTRLTFALNQMLDRISDAVERQRVFIALASHELRSPLAALRAELDLSVLDDGDMAEYRAAIQSAHVDVVRLGNLTTSLLELASTGDDAKTLARSTVSVVAMVDSVLRTLAPLITQAKAIVTVVAPDEVVCVDRARIEHALANLVANALVHSGAQAKVEIRGEIEKSGEERQLRLAVLDNGPGFGGDDPGQMFAPFRRGTRVAAVGSGLGLAMVAAAATAHRGTFGAANQAGGGAAVWLLVPATG